MIFAVTPASVGQNFGRPDGAADDLVQILDRLALSVNLAVSGERHRRAHHFDYAVVAL